MNRTRKIKVLIVDDSLVFREVLARGLAADPGIEVVATAGDAYSARDRIIEHEPHVMTLDVEMPGMNGIEFLKRLMPQYPIPVVVVSSISDNVFDALNSGAVDFVTKPDTASGRGMDSLINELIVKVKIASMAKVSHYKSGKASMGVMKQIEGDGSNIVIAIGASTGGTEATCEVLKKFPKDMPGIVVVQHMPPVFTGMYAERLNRDCAMSVKEAEDGDGIHPGRILVAPGEFHMKVKKSGGEYYVDCSKGERVNGHCPSVDVLFYSVAEKCGSKAIGVILTGMGNDGAKGLLAMKRAGARTLGQDEESCVVYGMPKVAYEIGAVEKQASLEGIALAIYGLVKKK